MKRKFLDFLPDLLVNTTDDTHERLKSLLEDMKRLCARKKDVRTEIRNAVLQIGKRPRWEVLQWLNAVKDKKAEVKSIEMEFQPNSISKKKLSGRIENLTKDVQKLIQQGTFSNGVVLDDYNMRALPLTMSKMVGKMFQKTFEAIMGWLEKSKPLIIGVYGMGGVGKTTLLKYIHNHLLSNPGITGLVHWVTVSHDCGKHQLQQKIFHAVTRNNLKEEDEEKRAAFLHNLLTGMGKIVLILDDLWQPYELDEIGIPLGEDNCKVILSSRSLEVCRRMGSEEFSVKVKPLSESEAWELFAEKLQNYEALDAEVKRLATLVANECCYLPLAINTIAISMRGVFDATEWCNALNELKDPIIRKHNREDEVFTKLKFSFDRLNDEIMQSCFLTCVLYPEDFAIRREELIEYWIMEGLLNGMESWQDKLNKGHSILNRLVNSGLLEKPTWHHEPCVKMHDLIRDMGIIITESHPRFMAKSGLLLKEVPEEDHWKDDLVKVSLSINEIAEIVMPESPRCPKLSVLMINENPLKRIPESFFINMRALTVLDMSDTLIQRLPDSICGLVNLRGLILRDCYELEYVPCLSKQTKLLVLDLGGVYKMKEAPSELENLRCLRKLKCNWDVNDMAYLKRLVESRHFSKINIYSIFLGDLDWEDTDDYIEEFDRTVIIGGKYFKQPVFIPSTVENLVIMYFDMEDRENTLGDIVPSLCVATELIKLHIDDCRGVGYISSSGTHQVSSNFDKLEKLRILVCEDLPDLKGLIGGKKADLASSSSSPRLITHRFTQLEKLYIGGCHQLKVVFQQELLQHQLCLPNLREIKVYNCQGVEEIFESAWNNGYKQTGDGVDTVNLILNLPILTKLKLWKLPKLRSIYKGLICAPLTDEFENDTNLKPERGARLVWDESLFELDSTSLKTPAVWRHLQQNYPEDAIQISTWMESRRREKEMTTLSLSIN